MLLRCLVKFVGLERNDYFCMYKYRRGFEVLVYDTPKFIVLKVHVIIICC